MRMVRAFVRALEGVAVAGPLLCLTALTVSAQNGGSYVGGGFQPVGSSAVAPSQQPPAAVSPSSASESSPTLARKAQVGPVTIGPISGGVGQRNGRTTYGVGTTVGVNVPWIGQVGINVGGGNNGWGIGAGTMGGTMGGGMYGLGAGSADFAPAACTVLSLPLGSFGALVMIVAGLIAVVSAAIGAYKAALSFLVVGVGSWAIYPLVTLFFGPVCSYF